MALLISFHEGEVTSKVSSSVAWAVQRLVTWAAAMAGTLMEASSDTSRWFPLLSIWRQKTATSASTCHFKDFFFFSLPGFFIRSCQNRGNNKNPSGHSAIEQRETLHIFPHGSNQLCYGFINVITQCFFEFCCRLVLNILQPNYNSLVTKFVFIKKGRITNLKHDYWERKNKTPMYPNV